MENRYLCTDMLHERGGRKYFREDTSWFAATPEGKYHTDMHKRPDIFRTEYHRGDELIVNYDFSRFFKGFHVMPQYSYDPDTDEFSRIDSWKEPWARAYIRRQLINDDIHKESICVQTELKHIRKAIVAIARELRMSTLPEVHELLDLSSSIEGIISRHDKTGPKAEEEAIRANYERDEFLMGEGLENGKN